MVIKSDLYLLIMPENTGTVWISQQMYLFTHIICEKQTVVIGRKMCVVYIVLNVPIVLPPKLSDILVSVVDVYSNRHI